MANTSKHLDRITDPYLAAVVNGWEADEQRETFVFDPTEREWPVDDTDEPDWEAMRDYTDEYREARFA